MNNHHYHARTTIFKSRPYGPRGQGREDRELALVAQDFGVSKRTV